MTKTNFFASQKPLLKNIRFFDQTFFGKESLKVKLSLERFVLNLEFSYLNLFRIWCLGFCILQ